MRVGLLHLGQSVDLVVSITFLRSPVFAIFAIGRVFLLRGVSLHSRAGLGRMRGWIPNLPESARLQRRGHFAASQCNGIARKERDSLVSVYMSRGWLVVVRFVDGGPRGRGGHSS